MRLRAHLHALRLVLRLRRISRRTGIPFEVLLAQQIQIMQEEAQQIMANALVEIGMARLDEWRAEAARQAERN